MSRKDLTGSAAGRDPNAPLLDVRDINGLRHVVRTLEVLAVTAFGDDDALEGLVVDDTTVWRGR